MDVTIIVSHVQVNRKVIESNRVIKSKGWKCNSYSNRFENLKCYSDSNRQHVIDPNPVSASGHFLREVIKETCERLF